MTSPLPRAIVAGLCVALAAATAVAHPRVERARKAYDDLRFEDVLGEIEAARREGGLARGDQAMLARLEAYTYAIYDDGPRAVAAFRRLLALEPRFALGPEISPKIRRYLHAARAPALGVRLPLGDATAVPVTPPPRPREPARAGPVYASGWFWAAVAGALGVGVGVGIGIAIAD